MFVFQQKTSFVYEVEKKPVSVKGYSLGSRTALRFEKEANVCFIILLRMS